MHRFDRAGMLSDQAGAGVTGRCLAWCLVLGLSSVWPGHPSAETPTPQSPYYNPYSGAEPWSFPPAQRGPRILNEPWNTPATYPGRPGNQQGYPPQNSQPYAPPAGPPSYGGGPAPYGVQPGYGPPGYAQPAYAVAANAQPDIEIKVDINDTTPYVQQTLVMRVRIQNSNVLRTVSVDPPQTQDLIFQQLSEPENTTEQGHTITEYRYALIPLRAGEIMVPPIVVSGTVHGGANGHFEKTSDQDLYLHVRSQDPAVMPWLPLRFLEARADLEGHDKAEAGRPIHLKVTLFARGATGGQLPSVESQLKSPAFRVYREHTEVEGKLSRDAAMLSGKRIESYTLVPIHGGRALLPDIQVPWWDVTSGTARVATIPSTALRVAGPRQGGDSLTEQAGQMFFPTGSSTMFWVPLLGVLLFVGVWWFWYYQKHLYDEDEDTAETGVNLTQRPHWLRDNPVLQEWLRRAWMILGKLRPRPHLHRLRMSLIMSLPVSIRFWYCVRYIEQENDPETWGQMLKFLSCKHLRLSPQASMPDLAEKIIEFQPGKDPAILRGLIKELDQAVYGRKPIQFAAWKQRFRRQIRPNLMGGGGQRRKRTLRRLPELNPTTGQSSG